MTIRSLIANLSQQEDLNFLLTSIVDPNAVIRKEFFNYIVQTKDGRVLTGLIVESSPTVVTVLDAKNQRTVIEKNQIESMKESPTSLMPENILKELKPQELRDLFGYLQSKPPPK